MENSIFINWTHTDGYGAYIVEYRLDNDNHESLLAKLRKKVPNFQGKLRYRDGKQWIILDDDVALKLVLRKFVRANPNLDQELFIETVANPPFLQQRGMAAMARRNQRPRMSVQQRLQIMAGQQQNTNSLAMSGANGTQKRQLSAHNDGGAQKENSGAKRALRQHILTNKDRAFGGKGGRKFGISEIRRNAAKIRWDFERKKARNEMEIDDENEGNGMVQTAEIPIENVNEHEIQLENTPENAQQPIENVNEHEIQLENTPENAQQPIENVNFEEDWHEIQLENTPENAQQPIENVNEHEIQLENTPENAQQPIENVNEHEIQLENTPENAQQPIENVNEHEIQLENTPENAQQPIENVNEHEIQLENTPENAQQPIENVNEHEIQLENTPENAQQPIENVNEHEIQLENTPENAQQPIENADKQQPEIQFVEQINQQERKRLPPLKRECDANNAGPKQWPTVTIESEVAGWQWQQTRSQKEALLRPAVKKEEQPEEADQPEEPQPSTSNANANPNAGPRKFNFRARKPVNYRVGK